MLGVRALLRGAQNRVAEVARQDLDAPGRRNHWFGQRRFEGQRVAQVIIGERIRHHHGQRVGLLPGRTARAPDPQPVIAPLPLAPQNFLQDVPLEQVELGLVAEEAGFVDREIFHQARQFLLSLVADQQPVVAVKRFQLAFAQTPLQPVLQEGRAPLIEVHAALLVHQRLQQFQFGIRDGRHFACAHDVFAGHTYLPAEAPCAAALPLLLAPASGTASLVPVSRAASTFWISSRMMSRPWYLPRPVTQSRPPSCIMAGAVSISLSGIFRTSEAESTIIPARRPRCSTTRMRLRRSCAVAGFPKRLRRSTTETILPRMLMTPSTES